MSDERADSKCRNEALHLLLFGTLRHSAFQDSVMLKACGQEKQSEITKKLGSELHLES